MKQIVAMKGVMSRAEYYPALVLVLLVEVLTAFVIVICFSGAASITIYPILFSAVLVFVIFINGYANYIESRSSIRKLSVDAAKDSPITMILEDMESYPDTTDDVVQAPMVVPSDAIVVILVMAPEFVPFNGFRGYA